jgi:hypothetical protein
VIKFAENLENFENMLLTLNPIVVKGLKNGIKNRLEIESVLKNRGLDSRDDIIAFYQWRNGFDYDNIELDGKMLFMPNGVFLSIDMMVIRYDFLTTNNYIEKKYFPLTYQDMYLIDLDKNSNEFGRIFFYSTGFLILKPVTIFDSLDKMIMSITTCFETGALWYNEEGYLETDYNKYNETCKINNPNSVYWNIKDPLALNT